MFLPTSAAPIAAVGSSSRRASELAAGSLQQQTCSGSTLRFQTSECSTRSRVSNLDGELASGLKEQTQASASGAFVSPLALVRPPRADVFQSRFSMSFPALRPLAAAATPANELLDNPAAGAAAAAADRQEAGPGFASSEQPSRPPVVLSPFAAPGKGLPNFLSHLSECTAAPIVPTEGCGTGMLADGADDVMLDASEQPVCKGRAPQGVLPQVAPGDAQQQRARCQAARAAGTGFLVPAVPRTAPLPAKLAASAAARGAPVWPVIKSPFAAVGSGLPDFEEQLEKCKRAALDSSMGPLDNFMDDAVVLDAGPPEALCPSVAPARGTVGFPGGGAASVKKPRAQSQAVAAGTGFVLPDAPHPPPTKRALPKPSLPPPLPSAAAMCAPTFPADPLLVGPQPHAAAGTTLSAAKAPPSPMPLPFMGAVPQGWFGGPAATGYLCPAYNSALGSPNPSGATAMLDPSGALSFGGASGASFCTHNSSQLTEFYMEMSRNAHRRCSVESGSSKGSRKPPAPKRGKFSLARLLGCVSPPAVGN